MNIYQNGVQYSSVNCACTLVWKEIQRMRKCPGSKKKQFYCKPKGCPYFRYGDFEEIKKEANLFEVLPDYNLEDLEKKLREEYGRDDQI